MDKDLFEILLEHIESNTKLLAEGLAGVNERLDRLEAGHDAINEKLLIQDVLQAGHKMTLSRLDQLEEGQQVTISRLDQLEEGQEVIKTDVRDIKERVERLEVNDETIKTDVRDIKRNMGLLNSIANDHESRLQGVENKLKDHIENHS